MDNHAKLKAFEYLLVKLVEWHNEASNGIGKNDISLLKGLKLLFFVSAVDAKTDSQNTLLDTCFNKFVAMPYGHVESDIYANIKYAKLENVKIDSSTTSILDKNVELDEGVKEIIDSSVSKLKTKNYNIIKMSAFELVELSHRWFSWKYYFSKARKSNISSIEIPNEIIKQEEKIFSLN